MGKGFRRRAGRSIGGKALSTHRFKARADINNPAAPLFDQERNNPFCYQEITGEVRLDRVPEFRCWHFPKWHEVGKETRIDRGHSYPGIIDQHIHSGPGPGHDLKSPLDGIFVTHITYYEKLERRISGERVSGEILEAEIVVSKPPTVQIPMQIQAPAETRLRQIDELFQKGILTQAERDEKRRQILGEL